MGEKQHRRWSRLSVIVAIAAFVVAFASFWLTFAIGYHDVNSGFRAWVDSAVASVSPWVASGGSLLVSFAVSALAGLFSIWMYDRWQRNWRHRWKQRRREHFGQEAVGRQAGDLPLDGLTEGEKRWAEEVEDLSIVAAWLLHLIVFMYSREPSGDVFVLDAELKAVALQLKVVLSKLREACAELVGADFLLDFDWREGDEGIKLVAELTERVKSRKAASELMSAIVRRLDAEGVWR